MALECVDLTSQSDLSSENVAEYSEFKIKFNRQLTVFYESLTGNLKKAWTRARIADVIEYIKDGKEAMKAGLRRTPMQYYWCAKYDILNVDNEEYLIFKQNHKDDPAVRVVAIEDYFDLLLEIHRENGHGGRDKLCKIIKNKYYIQKKPIEIFIALCPTCEIKRNLPKKGLVSKPMVSKDLNSRGLVDIIDFRSEQDGDYKFLLNYQDNVTKFIQLRPLITNQAPEIASELVKIFLIFGAPYILQSDSGREFTAKILREMLKMLPQCKIVHGGPKPPPQTQTLVDNVEKSTSEDVKDMLSTWMRDNLSKSWSVGCHIVQYQMNASYHKTIGRSPYRALFGCDPKMGLQSLNIPEDVLKTINTEEDLEKNQLSDGSTSWQCSDNGTSVPAELSDNQSPMAGRRDPNRFTPRQCATMIYHYGVSRGDALKAATLYRKHISKLPHTPGQVKRLPAYTFFLDLHKSLSDGVIIDLPEPDPKFLDTKREDENQSVVLTQLFNLGFKWKPQEVATMLYYYGVTGGHALRTANLYRRHVEGLPDTGVSKGMPGYGFFLDLYKSLSEGVLSAFRDQDCSERTDDRKPRPTLISRVNMNHDRSLDSSSAATSSESDLEVEEPELTSQPEPEPYGCHACNITFSGFVYECVQCEYRMCADCDHAGVHNEHYVLRVPAHSPREEVKEVVSKVRVALNLVELRPPPHAHKKHGRKRRDSDDGPPEVPVVVKMEVDIEEDDPLTFPRSPSPSPSPCPARVKREPDAAVPSDANMYAMLDTATEPQEDILQVIIKSEPPDEEPSTSQLPTTDPRHAQQIDLQRCQPHPQPQTTDTPGKRGADSAAEGKKPKKGRLKKKVDT